MRQDEVCSAGRVHTALGALSLSSSPRGNGHSSPSLHLTITRTLSLQHWAICLTTFGEAMRMRSHEGAQGFWVNCLLLSPATEVPVTGRESKSGRMDTILSRSKVGGHHPWDPRHPQNQPRVTTEMIHQPPGGHHQAQSLLRLTLPQALEAQSIRPASASKELPVRAEGGC